MAPVDSRDYVLSECGRCATHNVACQHSQQTRRWSNAGSMLANHLRRWPSIKPALVQRLVFAGLRSGGQYKPTPIQCLLNIEPASVLGSIHSALVSTSCWQYRYRAKFNDQLNLSHQYGGGLGVLGMRWKHDYAWSGAQRKCKLSQPV